MKTAPGSRQDEGALSGRGSARIAYALARIRACISYIGGPKDLSQARDPLFIGGTGGSGTRLIASLVKHAGYFIGSNLHRSQDSLDMDRFCDAWLERILCKADAGLPRGEQDAMDRDLERAVIWHRSAIPAADAPWALKHPRTVLMLPYLLARHPGMRFIHVVRDGRDMAFSNNTRQLEKYGQLILSALDPNMSPEENAAKFWALSNLRALEFAEAALGKNYKIVRFEDFCATPGDAISSLFEWIGAREIDADSARSLVAPPESIGRWRSGSEALIEKVSEQAEDALIAFGYK